MRISSNFQSTSIHRTLAAAPSKTHYGVGDVLRENLIPAEEHGKFFE